MVTAHQFGILQSGSAFWPYLGIPSGPFRAAGVDRVLTPASRVEGRTNRRLSAAAFASRDAPLWDAVAS